MAEHDRTSLRHSLICRVASRICAVPAEHVVETMRPLAIEAIAGTPSFLLGLAIIRGAPTPVVDAARLLSGIDEPSEPARFAVVKAGPRRVALAVDEVIGVRAVASTSLADLPPIMRAASAEVVRAIGLYDTELLMVLDSARLLPPSTWAALATREASP